MRPLLQATMIRRLLSSAMCDGTRGLSVVKPDRFVGRGVDREQKKRNNIGVIFFKNRIKME